MASNVANSKPLMRRGNIAGHWKLSEGEFMRDLREARGLTQSELADAVGISSKQMISHIENGRVHVPPDWVEPFAEALKIGAKELAVTLLRYQNPFLYAAIFGADDQLKSELKQVSPRFSEALPGSG